MALHKKYMFFFFFFLFVCLGFFFRWSRHIFNSSRNTYQRIALALTSSRGLHSRKCAYVNLPQVSTSTPSDLTLARFSGLETSCGRTQAVASQTAGCDSNFGTHQYTARDEAQTLRLEGCPPHPH